ncbi:hypothetical protein BGZ58_009641 [Dissophora ornata]|nr:hypothetical protein BGZ58_009641 [Dissophora ornata]
MLYKTMDTNDRRNHNTQSGQSDQGPEFHTNFSAESSILSLLANNSRHGTPAWLSAGPNITSDTAAAARKNVLYTSPPRPHSLGDTGAAASTSNPTKRCPYLANKRIPASPFCPFLKNYQSQSSYVPLHDARYPEVPLQESLSSAHIELASEDGQNRDWQDHRVTGNYAETGLHSGSVSGVSTNQSWSMAENQNQNVDGAEHIGNYPLSANTGVPLSMGTSAGLQYGSPSLTQSVTFQPFSGDYASVFSGLGGVIRSNGHGDIFLSPCIESPVGNGSTTQPPTQDLDQQSLPAVDSKGTIQRDPLVPWETNPKAKVYDRL